MKGIILAGGQATRLYPCTLSISKQILPIYNKPMIYYPLATLMQAGIREFLIISNKRDIKGFIDLFDTGKDLGIEISYAIQEEPRGIAEAFLIGRDFIGNDPVALILGDNIFNGGNLPQLLETATNRTRGATIFAYHVQNPQDYGVVSFDSQQKAVKIVEKPTVPESKYAVTGLYLYDNQVVDIVKSISPSARGELEITDVNNIYLRLGQLHVEIFSRGTAWLDTGTHDSLSLASQYVETIEKREGLKIGCIEEIAYRKGYISTEQLLGLTERLGRTEYGLYLQEICKEKLDPKFAEETAFSFSQSYGVSLQKFPREEVAEKPTFQSVKAEPLFGTYGHQAWGADCPYCGNYWESVDESIDEKVDCDDCGYEFGLQYPNQQ